LHLCLYLNVARMGDRSGVYKGLVGRPGRKRSLERLRHRLKDNIKMDLQGVGLRRHGSKLSSAG